MKKIKKLVTMISVTVIMIATFIFLTPTSKASARVDTNRKAYFKTEDGLWDQTITLKYPSSNVDIYVRDIYYKNSYGISGKADPANIRIRLCNKYNTSSCTSYKSAAPYSQVNFTNMKPGTYLVDVVDLYLYFYVYGLLSTWFPGDG